MYARIIDCRNHSAIAAEKAPSHGSAKISRLPSISPVLYSLIENGHTYTFAMARTPHQVHGAHRLQTDMYAWRGYRGSVSPSRCPRIGGPSCSKITLVAALEDRIVGTLTVAPDCREGMNADELFQEYIDGFRANNRQLCELTRLAVDNAHKSSRLLATLFHLAYLYAHRVRGCSDLIIEVNPRHTAFYGHSLGFRDRGDTRLCPRVNAPAKLMHLECDMAARLIRMCAGNPIHRSERFSFYRHFLTGAEGTVALNNLRRLASHGFSPQDCVTGCPAPSHPTPAVAAVAGS